MAIIILEPGEVFQHTHDNETTTGLVEGEVEFRMDGEKINLSTDTKVTIPAHTPHSMVNTGNEDAVIRCKYNC